MEFSSTNYNFNTESSLRLLLFCNELPDDKKSKHKTKTTTITTTKQMGYTHKFTFLLLEIVSMSILLYESFTF